MTGLFVCFQVVDLYWGVDPEEWDSPELQRLRMKLLEECLKTSAGPCFVVSITQHTGYSHSLTCNGFYESIRMLSKFTSLCVHTLHNK